ncbi:MAG: hypothetical protein JNM07_12620 [Phycisphaerae bacterium]|nr:hypothetical protein [Phycisphaerae bacterium]
MNRITAISALLLWSVTCRAQDCGHWEQRATTSSITATYGWAIAYNEWDLRFMVIGGALYNSTGEGEYASANVWGWNNGWNQLTDLPQQRAWPSAAYDSLRHRVVVFGGANYTGSSTRDTLAFHNNVWSVIASGGAPVRYHAAMAYDAGRDRVVLFGGSSASTTLGDTWEFDGTVTCPGKPEPVRMRGFGVQSTQETLEDEAEKARDGGDHPEAA